jgi:hypothetical protein
MTRNHEQPMATESAPAPGRTGAWARFAVPLAGLGVAMSLSCVVGCNGSGAARSGGSGDAGNGGQGGGGGGEAGGEGGAIDASVACNPDAGSYVGPLATPSGDATTVLAVNLAKGTLFAALVNSQADNDGIAVFSTATNTLGAIIPPPTVDGGPVPPYSLAAVDSTHDALYALRQFSETIDVFDGATNSYTSSIDVASLDSNCPTAVDVLLSIAVDPERSRLYTSCTTSQGVEVSAFDVSGPASLAGSVLLSDLGGRAELGLDATNQTLFVASIGLGEPSLLVDVVDTGTLKVIPNRQLDLGPTNLVGILGGNPTAVIAPGNGRSNAGVSKIVSLEGMAVTLSPTFQPATFELASPVDLAITHVIYGYDTALSSQAVLYVSVPGDGGAPDVLGESPLSLPNAPVAQLSFVAGSGYSYVAGLPGTGPGGLVSDILCLP